MKLARAADFYSLLTGRPEPPAPDRFVVYCAVCRAPTEHVCLNIAGRLVWACAVCNSKPVSK